MAGRGDPAGAVVRVARAGRGRGRVPRENRVPQGYRPALAVDPSTGAAGRAVAVQGDIGQLRRASVRVEPGPAVVDDEHADVRGVVPEGRISDGHVAALRVDAAAAVLHGCSAPGRHGRVVLRNGRSPRGDRAPCVGSAAAVGSGWVAVRSAAFNPHDVVAQLGVAQRQRSGRVDAAAPGA